MPVHKHMIIRAEVNRPLVTEKQVRRWLRSLVKKIDMNIIKGPYAAYVSKEGNRGVTGVVMIETSHIAMHVWDEDNPALIQLDVYSCKDLDEEIVFSYLYKFMPVRMSYRYFDRETNFKLIKVQNEYKTSKKN